MRIPTYEEVLKDAKIKADVKEAELERLAEREGKRTQFGSLAFVSNIRARSGPFTRNSADSEITKEDIHELRHLKHFLHERELIQLDAQMGDNTAGIEFHCRLYIPTLYNHLGLSFIRSLTPLKAPKGKPDFVTIMLPHWNEGVRRMLVDAANFTTFVLGSDYFGEIKKSFLRMAMYRVKLQGMLGLHAGSKEVIAKDDKTGKLRRQGLLFFGLSGTGKTTLTCHQIGMNNDIGERARVRQDDVVLLASDGKCYGTEGRGFFIKTEDLSEEEQPDLYKASIHKDTLFHNVWVDDDGTVDFFNSKLTKNGRAVVPIDEIPIVDKGNINMELADHFFFITRNPLVAPIARLTTEQGACAFMLGESVKTSAADPQAQGEAVRVVGTNPFIMGSETEEGNIFYDFLKKNPNIKCYLLNTGSIGSYGNARHITLSETLSLLKALIRNEITWEMDPLLRYEIPQRTLSEELSHLNLRRYFPEFHLQSKLTAIRKERNECLDQFPDLDPKIRNAVY